MGKLQFHSRVGADGVLSLSVPLGQAEANADVVVTIQPIGQTPDSNALDQDWHQFVNQTYGSCANLGLEEPPELPISFAF